MICDWSKIKLNDILFYKDSHYAYVIEIIHEIHDDCAYGDDLFATDNETYSNNYYDKKESLEIIDIIRFDEKLTNSEIIDVVFNKFPEYLI